MSIGRPRIRVLIVFANPRDTSPLRLGEEERAIREAIRRSIYRDLIEVTTIHAATIHDLRRALLEQEFQIVQVSGHGAKKGIILEDEQGYKYTVPRFALAELFHTYSPPLQCVILNACYSVEQGEIISLGVPYTIVMETAIDDKSAIEFSRGFYDALGAGKDIEFAYQEGCRTVKLAVPDAVFQPRLFKQWENGQTEPVFVDESRVWEMVMSFVSSLRSKLLQKGISIENYALYSGYVILRLTGPQGHQIFKISIEEFEKQTADRLAKSIAALMG